MPSKREYDLVSDDGYDTRIPLHNEDAFQHGIHFKAKLIGSMDVPRPSSRVEIVAAMRRIRYEFKAKAIKKKKVNIIISVDGVKINLRKKKKKITGQWSTDEKEISSLMQHPIYRIFYVSHDSQDLKIWSYIARDGSTNVFKCNVFKANKKEQAMRIVRSIGQAFEVCHKISLQHAHVPEPPRGQEVEGSHSFDTEKRSSKSKEYESREDKNRESIVESSTSSSSVKGRATPPNELALRQAQQLLYQMGAARTPTTATNNQIGGTTISSPISPSSLLDDSAPDPQMPLTSHHQLQLLRQQVEQQQQQTQVAIAQVQLLKDQLTAETSARIEAQARAHQLLLHNRDLLDHMSQLLTRLQELELPRQSTHSSSSSVSSEVSPHQPPHTGTNQLIPTMSSLPDPTTPQCGPVYLPSFAARDLDGSYLVSPESMTMENAKTFDTDSPDSGHREMSAENLSQNFLPSNDAYWPGDNTSDRTLYSYGFSSPVKVKNMYSYEMSATISSNPFAGGNKDFDVNNFEQSDSTKWKDSDERVKVINPSQEAGGNKLELKLNVTPKIKPPPQFRNTDSVHLSHSSDDSNDSENNSVKEGALHHVNSDSDYYSTHTGSSTKTNGVHNYGDESRFHDNRDVWTKSNHNYRFEYHYNNLGNEDLSRQHFIDDQEEEEEEEPRVTRETQGYHGSREYSYSDEENTFEETSLTKPPSPPPPPRRLERTVEEYETFAN